MHANIQQQMQEQEQQQQKGLHNIIIIIIIMPNLIINVWNVFMFSCDSSPSPSSELVNIHYYNVEIYTIARI